MTRKNVTLKKELFFKFVLKSWIETGLPMTAEACGLHCLNFNRLIWA